MNAFDMPPNEDRERVSLCNMLALARGFGVFFVVCNDATHLQSVFDELAGEREGAEHHRLSRGCVSLFREVEDKCNDDNYPLFVSRLDATMSGDSDPALHPFVANLNATRNSLVVHCQRPLVLGVGEYALKALANGAPDFFSLRSGTFWLPKNNASTASLPLNFQYDCALFSQGANYGHLLDTISKTRKSFNPDPGALALLTRLQAMDLMNRRLWSGADYALRQALHSIRKAIRLAPDVANLRGEQALCFLALAHVLRRWGKPSGARRAYAEARVALDEMHHLLASGGTTDIEYHLQLGTDWLEDEQFAEAEASLQEAARVADLLDQSNPVGLDKQRSYIAVAQGVLFQRTNRLMEAEAAYRSSLELEKRHNSPDSSLPLLRLAMLHEQMGRIPEAAAEFQKAVWQSAFSDLWVSMGLAASDKRSEFLAQALEQWVRFENNCGFPKRAERLHNLQRDIERGDWSHLREVLDAVLQETTHENVASAT